MLIRRWVGVVSLRTGLIRTARKCLSSAVDLDHLVPDGINRGGCDVPTVTGASVTGCTEGGRVDDGTTCTWTAQETHTCSDIGAITCDDGVWYSGGTPVETPSCNARHEDGLKIAMIF